MTRGHSCRKNGLTMAHKTLVDIAGCLSIPPPPHHHGWEILKEESHALLGADLHCQGQEPDHRETEMRCLIALSGGPVWFSLKNT